MLDAILKNDDVSKKFSYKIKLLDNYEDIDILKLLNLLSNNLEKVKELFSNSFYTDNIFNNVEAIEIIITNDEYYEIIMSN